MPDGGRIHCAAGGLLVGSQYPLVDEAHPPPDDGDLAAGRYVGCSCIRCASCGRRVRHFERVVWRKVPSLAELEKAYRARDYSSLLAPAEKAVDNRCYACACGHGGTFHFQALDEIDFWPAWYCEGHLSKAC
ncbi:MAG: hypothetical protein JXR96_26635 [Deltaproteobacteria bacterium]|nr:hypothetical protein [Deltaproteobacteria bacterium]